MEIMRQDKFIVQQVKKVGFHLMLLVVSFSQYIDIGI